MRLKTSITVCLLVVSLLAAGPSCAAVQRRPNVVIILTDDQGFGELGATGNPLIRTPHIDRLASQGAWPSATSTSCRYARPPAPAS